MLGEESERIGRRLLCHFLAVSVNDLLTVYAEDMFLARRQLAVIPDMGSVINEVIDWVAVRLPLFKQRRAAAHRRSAPRILIADFDEQRHDDLLRHEWDVDRSGLSRHREVVVEADRVDRYDGAKRIASGRMRVDGPCR